MAAYRFALCWAVAAATWCPAAAQAPTPPGFEARLQARHVAFARKDASLAETVAALAAQLGVNILVDGDPVAEHLGVELDTDGKRSLDIVADRFDYVWSVGERGTVLLRKRFKDEQALPQLNLPEMQHLATEFARLLPEGSTPGRPIYPMNALYRTLAPPQVAALSRGEKIPYAALRADQQRLVSLAIRNNMGDARALWQQVADELGAAPSGYIQWRHWHHPIARKRDPLQDGDLLDPDHTGQHLVDEQHRVVKDMVMRDAEGDELLWVWHDKAGREHTRRLAATEPELVRKGPLPTGPDSTKGGKS